MNAILDYFQTAPVTMWLSLAVALIIIEIISPAGFFLSFAVAAAAIAVKAWLFGVGGLLDILVFSAIGVVLIVPFRALLRRFFDKTDDINDLGR